MIEVLFSREFDSGVWTGAKPTDWAIVGQVALGELGLIDLYETQLGIKQPESLSYKRKIDFLNALKSADNKNRFYSESLIVDPMAVAEHLLHLRDNLIESGWDKKPISGFQKISDLSEVEKSFNNHTGKADRLIKISEALSKVDLPISVKVMDDLKILPMIWKKILSKSSEVKLEKAPDLKNDLGKFLKLRKTESKADGDGSLRILIGRDPWESARFLSALLYQIPKTDWSKTVIIAPEKHRGILMNAMIAQGIPFGGNYTEVSYSRPALQILILALALNWEPKDPIVALSLLTIKGSPAWSGFRKTLIKTLDESLAVGGKTWTTALDEIAKVQIEKEENSEEKLKIEKRKDRIKDWFSAPSFSYEQGIPVKEITETCDRVSKWLRQMWILKKEPSFREASEISSLLSNLANNIGEETITRERMLHLLTDAIGDGVSTQGIKAQANGIQVVSSPGSIVGSVNNLIWWDFSASTVRNFREEYFSKEESDVLNKSNILWPNPEELAIFSAKSWMRSLSNVNSKLLLVSQLLDSEGNDESIHPLFDELMPKNLKQDWLTQICVSLYEKQSVSTKKFLAEIGSSEINKFENNFQDRPEWKLDKDVLGLRETESATSLERLLNCELAYVLKGKAHLSGEDNASLKYDSRIMGIIAHEVIFLVFKKGEIPNVKDVVEQAKNIIDDVIKDKAPQLYLKENALDLRSLKDIVIRDIEIYGEFLRKNELAVYLSEEYIEKSEKGFAGVNLSGQLDQVLNDKNGNFYIIDHKLGSGKYREASLKEGKSLQLALYSKLLNEKKLPDLGYHIITDNKIYLLNKSLEGAQKVDGPDGNEVLLDGENAVKEKVKILKSGKLIAQGHLEDTPKDKDGNPEICKFCDFTNICGLAWKGN